MLLAVQGAARGFQRLRGILIAADNSLGPEKTFAGIARQIKNAKYPEPRGLGEVAGKTQMHPAISVTLLPDNVGSGGLESLFVRAILADHPWIENCVEAFLRCDQITAYTLEPEKLGKARYHSMVAALHRDDPSRAASATFRDPSVIPIASPVFRESRTASSYFATQLDCKMFEQLMNTLNWRRQRG